MNKKNLNLDNTPYEIVGSMIGNAQASNVSLAEIIELWYYCEDIDQLDNAVAMLGRLKLCCTGELRK